jgi:hypothetical protein
VISANAIADFTANPAVFGSVRRFLAGVPAMAAAQYAPAQLGVNEHLFITAHGMQGELGNHGGATAWNPVQLFDYLTNATPNPLAANIFPANYAGNIYISVCYGANVDRATYLSFAERFYAVLAPVLPRTRVFAQPGSAPMSIPLPTSNAYWQVTRY